MNDWETSKLVDNRAEVFLKETSDAILNIDITPGFTEAVRAISDCQGKVITTGMGKAGHAAKKVASSMSSMGIPSTYIHPGESAHGDIGCVSEEDILLAFSTSGKTREVVETVGFARRIGVSKVISVTSHKDAEIRSISDIVVDMGEITEAGYLHIAPTTSIVVMLVIADMLTIMAAELRGFKMEDYALRHHGGYLGMKSRGEVPNEIK